MVIDTSAVIACLVDEPEREAFTEAIDADPVRLEQVFSNLWWLLRSKIFWLPSSKTFSECLQRGTCGALSVSTRSQTCIVLYPSDEFVVFHTLLLISQNEFQRHVHLACAEVLVQNPRVL